MEPKELAELLLRIETLENKVDNLEGCVYDPWETGESLTDAMEDVKYQLANPEPADEEDYPEVDEDDDEPAPFDV